MARGQGPGQHIAGEGLVGHGGQLGVEGDAVEAVDAQVVQHPRLLVQGGEAEVGLVGPEPAAGVRLEGEHGQGRVQGARRAGGQGDDLPVAAVHPVEGAERQRRTAVAGFERPPAVDHLQAQALAPHAGARGASTTASPSTTGLPATVQVVASVTRPRSRSTAVTATRTVTSSPGRTGRRKLSDCCR